MQFHLIVVWFNLKRKKRGIASADREKEEFDYKTIDFSYDFKQCLKAWCMLEFVMQFIDDSWRDKC